MLYLYRKQFIIIITLFAVNKVCMNEQETSTENDSECISKVNGNELNEVDDVEDGEISDSEYDDYDGMIKNDPSQEKRFVKLWKYTVRLLLASTMKV